ncbi:unnamed protein product [Effrenium voratum]|nr:unnamed protein product [Effrenium voratum]
MFGDWTCRNIESKAGRLPLFGRYHQAPRSLEDDYEVTKTVLGSGVSGDVLLGISRLQRSRQVAIKTASLVGVAPQKVEDLKSELKILLCMDHPHVVRLLDVYVSDTKLDMVMECMQGGELKKRCQQIRMEEEEAAALVRQMLLALSYLHGHGVVHRDLKVGNFMYTRDRQVLKLIDFGLSKFYGRPTDRFDAVMRTCCGTLGYCAPEVFAEAYNSQCDMWSLGVLVYLLLSGEMPFFDKNEEILVAKTRRGEYQMKPTLWMGVSLEAADFTQALLRVDPEKRMTANEALQHPWLQATLPPIVRHVSASILEDLGNFAEETPLRRSFKRLMAISLDDGKLQEQREAFLVLDASHQGKILAPDLEEMLKQRLELDPDKAQDVTRALDIAGDNSVRFTDFLAATFPSTDLEDSLLQTTFRRLDREAKGHVSIEDVHAVVGELRDGPPGELLKWLEAVRGRRLKYPQFKAYLDGSEDPIRAGGQKGCCCLQ